jgi:hypothetical protein
MRMRMSTEGVQTRVTMFVGGVNRVYVIVAMLSLIHQPGLKGFVCRTTTPADRQRQQCDDQSCTFMRAHDPDGFVQLRSNAVYLLTRLKVGDWTWFVW